MMRFPDLADIIKRELGESAAKRVLNAICRDAAGEQVYIPARPSDPELLPTDTVKTIRRRHAVSRSTAYNWINKYRL